MRWREKNQSRPYCLEFIYSMEIVSMAYDEGFINWNVYQKAIKKINSNKNGGWMFENGNIKIDFEKIFED